jgi:hypothetical protein
MLPTALAAAFTSRPKSMIMPWIMKGIKNPDIPKNNGENGQRKIQPLRPGVQSSGNGNA